MKVEASGSFAAPIYLIVLLLALGFSVVVNAQAPADDDSPAELNRRIVELYREGKFKEAIPLAEKLVALTKRAKGDEDPDTATSLNNLAELYQATGDYAKTEPLLKEVLAISQKVLGREHPDTATDLNNLAALYWEMGDYSKAEPLYKEALEVFQKVLGREHPNTAQSLYNLAVLYQAMGDYAKAEPLYKEALEIRQKVLGPEHPDTAQSLNNLAGLYKATGDYPKAEPLYKEALEIYQKVLGPEHPDTAQSLNNLAGLYKATGDYPKAEPLYKEALEIYQKVLGRDHADTAASLTGLAVLYQAMGDYAKAEPLLKEALGIKQKVLGRDHPDTATSLNNLALLYKRIGDYAEAEPLYKEALEIRQKVLGREHSDTAISLDNLAELYEAMGDYAEAEPLYKEALEIRQKVFGLEHPDTATSLNNLAELYWARGDYAKAEPLYKEALEINQKVLGRDHPDTAGSLNNLALLYKEALEIFQKALGPEHPNAATSLNNLAYLELDLGENQEAKRLGQLGYTADLKVFSQILSFGSEDQRLAYQRLLDPYALFAALGESDPFLAGAVLHYKGVVLDSIIEDRLLAETGKEEANRDLVKQLNAKKRVVAQMSLQTTAASSKEATERIQALEREVEDIEGRLARQGTDLGQARRALTATVEQVQAAIPKNTALIEYVRYFHYLGKSKFECRYGAVVFSTDAPPRWVTLGSAKEIEAALKRYQALVHNPGDEVEMAAILQMLYTEVWEPVEQAFPVNTNRVIVSPDGQLNFLSFATLLDAGKGFVAEKYSIQYVTSGRDLLREPQPTLTKQVIVMANPKFKGDLNPNTQMANSDLPIEGSGVLRGTEKRDFEDMKFEDLAGTQQESDQLICQFKGWDWPAKSLMGAKVTKQALSELHGPHILHLATHGFFEPEDSSSETNPNESEAPGVKSDLTKSRFFKNPMNRSGLALAGANTTIEAWKRGEAPSIQEDGILTAEDVSTLDLKGTWLVTLSACDTGSGEARAGEGVMGLRRGFIQAGAQNLLMTLWPISDEVTVQIM